MVDYYGCCEVEVFKPIKDYPAYRVSNLGRVETCWKRTGGRNAKMVMSDRWRPLAGSHDDQGRYGVALCRGGEKKPNGKSKGKTFRVHNLVLEAFVGPRPSDLVCRHWDGNPRNNRVDNLSWGTMAENQRDRIRHGTDDQGSKSYHAKLTEDVIPSIRDRYANGTSLYRLGKIHNVAASTIKSIVERRTWDHVA